MLLWCRFIRVWVHKGLGILWPKIRSQVLWFRDIMVWGYHGYGLLGTSVVRVRLLWFRFIMA